MKQENRRNPFSPGAPGRLCAAERGALPFPRSFGTCERPPRSAAQSLRVAAKHSVACIVLLFVGIATAQDPPHDPYRSIYTGYSPDFIPKIEKGVNSNSPFYQWKRDAEQMKLSSETSFFTLNVLEEDSRANALVEAGLKREQEGQYREALKIYQQVIEKYPQSFYRVSVHGVFVPVAQYCQRRILQFPPADLAFYRTLYDAGAKEAFENARRQYSMLGMADVAEKMLATTYGARAVLELGNAALDAGHYLAALEHFTTVRDSFPDADLRTPELSLKITLCEKMLGNDKTAAAPCREKPRARSAPSNCSSSTRS